jgi:hypothetical protein
VSKSLGTGVESSPQLPISLSMEIIDMGAMAVLAGVCAVLALFLFVAAR